MPGPCRGVVVAGLECRHIERRGGARVDLRRLDRSGRRPRSPKVWGACPWFMTLNVRAGPAGLDRRRVDLEVRQRDLDVAGAAAAARRSRAGRSAARWCTPRRPARGPAERAAAPTRIRRIDACSFRGRGNSASSLRVGAPDQRGPRSRLARALRPSARTLAPAHSHACSRATSSSCRCERERVEPVARRMATVVAPRARRPRPTSTATVCWPRSGSARTSGSPARWRSSSATPIRMPTKTVLPLRWTRDRRDRAVPVAGRRPRDRAAGPERHPARDERALRAAARRPGPRDRPGAAVPGRRGHAQGLPRPGSRRSPSRSAWSTTAGSPALAGRLGCAGDRRRRRCA